MTATYRVTHRTEYEYAAVVRSGYSQLRLLPRDLPGQRCLESDITVDPAPDDRHEHVDFFGNRVTYIALQQRHRALSVTARSLVEVQDRAGVPVPLAEGVSEAVEAAQFVLDSPRIKAGDAFAAYAAPSFEAGRAVEDAVVDLAHRIHADFEYKPGKTRTDTTPEEVLRKRRGVCQDFAQVGIACLRSIGLPARYVSGYLETVPPAGRARLVGADASHAWFSALVPGQGWLDVDPTNDQIANERYVVVAHGRDYADVAPIGGVIFTRGKKSALKVSVDVVPV
jgi:transglutaminase-like putative cysteine protease